MSTLLRNTKLRWITSSAAIALLALAALFLAEVKARPPLGVIAPAAIDGGPVARNATYVAGSFTFSAPLQMPKPLPNPQVFFIQGAEPEIKVDLFGNIYLTAIDGVPGGTDLWKSVDNGATFQYLGQPDGTQDHCVSPSGCPALGGGDDSIDVSSGGYLYVSSLWLGDVTLSTSFDGGMGGTLPGQAWQVNPAATSGVSAADDRQWLVAYGSETVYMAYREAPGTGSLFFVKSTDAGKTFGPPVLMKLANSTQGNLVVDPYNGNLYSTTIPSATPREIHLLKSTDAGATWTESTVYTAPANTNPALKFTILAVDRGGNLHLVFARGDATTLNNTHVYLMSSPNQGATWLAPVRVDNGAGNATGVMPWVVGGSPGVVDITWLGSTVASPNTAGPWHVFFAQTANALATNPTFAQVQVTSMPMHDKVICFNGTGCAAGTRDLLEYYAMTLDPEGRAHIAFPDSVNNCPDDACVTQAWYSRQTDGGVAYTPPAAPAAATFAPNVSVGAPGAEPSLWVDSYNCVYVTAPGNPWVWKSVNGGVTFLPPVNPVADEATLTGGDEDIISLPKADGTRPDELYFTDLGLSTCHIRKSTDGGAMWFKPGPGGSGGEVSVSSDRQWLAWDRGVPTANDVVIYHWEHELATEAMRFSSMVNDTTWTPTSGMTDPELFDPMTNTLPNTNPGPIFVNHATHRVFALFNGSVPTNNLTKPPFGKLLNTWEADAAPPAAVGAPVTDVQNHPVHKGTYDSPNNPPPTVGPPVGPNYGTSNANIFPAGDIDAAGNIYVAWSMNNSRTNEFSVWMAVSHDQGKTYYGPFPISSGPLAADETALFPWVAAGDDGRVNIVFYKTTSVGDPNTLPTTGVNTANWHVFMAQSLNASGREPVFTVSQVSDHVMHKGAVSTGGLIGNSDRSLLDFFEVSNGADGLAYIIFADNGSTATHAEFARQMDGPRMRANPVTRTCLAPSIVPLSAVSRQTHGPQGTFDINMPLAGASGVECRRGGANGDYQLVVIFANPVSVAGTGSVTGTGSVSSVTANGVVVTVNLTGVTSPQKITVNIDGVNDGTNPAGAVSIPMGICVGDTNGDRTDNSGDAQETRNRSGQLANGATFRSDVNTDGSVNSGDAFIVRAESGDQVPP